jgi:hypothetical protein
VVAARSEGRRGGAEAVVLPGRWRRQPTRDDRGGGESQQASLDAWTRGIVSGFGKNRVVLQAAAAIFFLFPRSICGVFGLHVCLL